MYGVVGVRRAVQGHPTDLLFPGGGSVPVLRFRSLKELIVSVGVSVRETKRTAVGVQFQNKRYMAVLLAMLDHSCL